MSFNVKIINYCVPYYVKYNLEMIFQLILTLFLSFHFYVYLLVIFEIHNLALKDGELYI